MRKVKLTNKMAQAIPVLLKEEGSQKRLCHIQIPRKGSKIVFEDALSPHCQSLFKKGLLGIEFLEEVKFAPKAAVMESKTKREPVLKSNIKLPVKQAGQKPDKKKASKKR